MSGEGIHNIPQAIYCVGVTNTVPGHNIIDRATSKPTNGTSKSGHL
jgi:hypothetical protein